MVGVQRGDEDFKVERVKGRERDLKGKLYLRVETV